MTQAEKDFWDMAEVFGKWMFFLSVLGILLELL